MALLPVLEFPDPRLRTKATPVVDINDHIRQLAKDMIDTMYHEEGIGLAGTQVDFHQRILVMDVSEDQDQPMVLINPQYRPTGDKIMWKEGCLSVPAFYEEVERYSRIAVSAFNEQGEPVEFEAADLMAICVQHEIDHLDGKLFVDYISNLKRNRIRQKLEKLHKLQGKA